MRWKRALRRWRGYENTGPGSCENTGPSNALKGVRPQTNTMNDALLDDLATFTHDPLGFVVWAFPWGEPGELEDAEGPEPWQREILEDIGRGLISWQGAIQLAVASGHGIGKTALVAWIILWSMSTFEDTKGVVTANTENQLRTKTWPELSTWYRRLICRDMFRFTATALFSADPEHERTWRFDMIPWSARNPEAFAGLHNKGKRIVVLFDESSAVEDVIWETVEGALTDSNTEIIWAAFGNPTKNTGRFRECFPGGRFARRWKTRNIDSRTVSFTDKDYFNRMVEDWGEDHDQVRVRVKGMFPRVDATSFIPLELALEASRRDVEPQEGMGIVIGVDVGRFGDDPSVLYPRRGLDAHSWQPEVLYGQDTMEVASRAMALQIRLGADLIIVDEGGVGGGVVDRLRQLRAPVLGVDFGAGPDGYCIYFDQGTKFANKRAEIWGEMRGWLKEGAIVDRVHDFSLIDELVSPHYIGLDKKERIRLEAKEDMKRRGVASPNIADALACTFAYPTPRVQLAIGEFQPVVMKDYDPFSKESIYGTV